jgi:RNA polymerase sigma-70 factor, ECF subfamily
VSQRDPLARERDAIHERSLMERIHAGDPSALDTVLERYWVPLVSYAARLLQDRDAAEDVVQEAVLAVWRERTRWTPTGQLRGFLYQITRNLALNERKRMQVRRAWAQSARDAPPKREPTPLDLTERAELRDVLDTAVDALSPKRREIFILARYHGHTYREIAEIMGIPPQTVANQMSAALDDLRSRLRPLIDGFLETGQLRVILGGESAPAEDGPDLRRRP